MKPIFVRPARQEDIPKITSWTAQNPAWDSTLYKYQTTFTLCAFNSEGVIAFVPVQQPLMMEALLFHPLSTPTQRALALREFADTLITQSYQRNSGEIYFLCPKETPAEVTTCGFAEHWGFKRVDMPVYRIRLTELERGKSNGSTT